MSLAQRLDALREVTPRRPWREQVRAEWEPLREALEWTLAKHGNILLGQRLVGSLETAWWVLPEGEAQRWLRAAFEAADDSTPRNVLARLNLALARLRIGQNRFKSCNAAAQRGLSFSQAVGDDVGVARGAFLAGHSLVAMGELAEGERLLRAALADFRKLDAPRSAGRTLVSIALAREYAGDIPSAIAFCTEGVETLRAIEGDDGTPDHVSYLAELQFRAGNPEQALALVSLALERHRTHNEKFDVLVDLSNTAAYLIALDRYDEAQREATESLALADEEKNSLWRAFAVQHLAAIAALRGEAVRAAQLLGFSDAHLAELGYHREHTEQQEYSRVAAALRERLGEDEMQRLMAEGRSWAADRAVAEARENAQAGKN